MSSLDGLLTSMLRKSKLEKTQAVLLGDHEENDEVGETGHRKELVMAANFHIPSGGDPAKECTIPEQSEGMKLEEE